MPDGSYPIRSAKDVENAVRDYFRTGKKAGRQGAYHCARQGHRRRERAA